MPSDIEFWDGRQIAAARALAGLTVRDLADKASTTKRVISEIETSAVVRISPGRQHGHVSAELWTRIINALKDAGVELLPERSGHGTGARWTRPRSERPKPHQE
jgi:transcriptional regulator with XRE-family HTH domain